jgi:hypothetical protein
LLPLGKHPADAAARIWLIPGVSWDEVDVQMHHRLPGRCAHIDADIEAVRLALRLEPIGRLA